MTATEIEEAIGQVTRLYKAVTGSEAPAVEGIYAPIPAEKDPQLHVQEQMDRLLAMLSAPPTQGDVGVASQTNPGPTFAPPVTLFEGTNELCFAFDVPGVSREAIDVRIERGVLVVSGSRQAAVPPGTRLAGNERPVGTFRRAIPLPRAAKTEALAAQLRDGVLEVRVPVDTTANGRKVPVA